MANFNVTFKATVNDVERSVSFPLDVAVDQLLRGGYEWLENEAELWVMNDQGLYNEFYDGAEDKDFDATLEDVSVEVEEDF